MYYFIITFEILVLNEYVCSKNLIVFIQKSEGLL